MIELIFGAVLGALVSVLIAEIYHRRSSRDMDELISRLQEKNDHLGEMLDNLEGWQEFHHADLQTIRKHAVAGTTDDPDYPYK